MATSPIYGWLEPDNSDLVKNGALAIRTLGNAIDTTMATMTPKSIVDAKGDLIAASAADTPARLAVGNNGETLVADSSATSGLKYTASNAAGRNYVTNGAFDVWQRGTSFSVAANAFGYYADRWMCDTGPNQASTFSRQVTGDTTNLPNIQYCLRFQRNSGQTGTGVQALITSLETVNSIPLAGRTVTLSFYARAGANYSASSSALVYRLLTGTGTDQNALTVGYTGQANTINETATLTTTWQRFSTTVTMPTTTTEAAVYFRYTPTGTAGAADYYEVTGIQLEVGSVATAFTRQGGTIQGELAACQRYCQRVASSPTAGSECFSMAFAVTSSTVRGVINLAVPMRTNPTVTASSGTNFFLTYINAGIAYYSTLTLVQGSPNTVCWAATLTAGSNTAGQAGGSDISATGTAGANSVILSAEL